MIETYIAYTRRGCGGADERAVECVSVRDYNNIRAQLAAAEATLAKIREVAASKEWEFASHTDYDGVLERIEDILYPATETKPFTADDAHHGLTGE